MDKSIALMVDLMKNIVGNWKLINVKIMNFDVVMVNVYQNRFIEIIMLLLLTVLMVLTNRPHIGIQQSSVNSMTKHHFNVKMYHVNMDLLQVLV
jgi:hypothetical protein